MENLAIARSLPFHIMTKPIGATCNLDCEYCFYLTKSKLYPNQSDFRMQEHVLEEYIVQYIAQQPGPEVSFAWQGGEPTLMGLDFFRKVVELQEANRPKGWTIANSIQTNGMLLDNNWCEFLRKHKFLVGLSLDGPPELHDRYRKDKKGGNTSAEVRASLERMQASNVEFNVLCVVNNVNVEHPLKMYHYFKELGVNYLQFIPIVEQEVDGKVGVRSVGGIEYGRFLTQIYNEWVCEDLGEIYVQLFEGLVGIGAGMGPSVCVFAPTCGRFLAMEHNGDVYACDHYVDPDHLLGNFLITKMVDMVDSPNQKQFGQDKLDTLTEYCKRCPVLTYCYGGCPKNRVGLSPDGEAGHNHLCAGYRQFFTYVQPFNKAIVSQLQQRQAPHGIRQLTKDVYRTLWDQIGRNDLCPCQSGKKYKKCCG